MADNTTNNKDKAPKYKETRWPTYITYDTSESIDDDYVVIRLSILQDFVNEMSQLDLSSEASLREIVKDFEQYTENPKYASKGKALFDLLAETGTCPPGRGDC